MEIDEQIAGLETNIELHEKLLLLKEGETLDINFICEILLKDFIERKKARLNKLKEHRLQKAIPEFEKLSAECNQNIDKIVERAKKHIGKEPFAITKDINELVNNYQVEENMIQEEKNRIYVRLNQHLNFLTNKYQNK